MPSWSNGCVVNVGTASRSSLCRIAGPEWGQVHRRLMAVKRGGGPVVVRARERRVHGEGDQQVGGEDAGMPGVRG